jgi:predicted transcriptional regulator
LPSKLSTLGALESEVLEVIKSRGPTTASEVAAALHERRPIAYTTVGTTLDRLYKKKLLQRKAIPGPGGTKYVFSLGRDERLKRKIVESTLDRLTDAFGQTAYSAIYEKLESLPSEELARLKKQIETAKKKRD